MLELFYGLLDALMDAAAYSAIGCLCLALVSMGMMVIDAALGNVRRTWSVGLLSVAIIYAAANVGAFIVTISADAFAIFELAYILSVGAIAPSVMMLALILVAKVYRQFRWLSILGFILWVGCVTFAHLFVIAVASAGV